MNSTTLPPLHHHKHHRFLMTLFFALSAAWMAAAPLSPLLSDSGESAIDSLPVRVLPNDLKLRYVGRFQIIDSEKALCEWSASSISIRFQGTDIHAMLDLGENRMEVVLDGRAIKVLTAETPGLHLYSLASKLPNTEHCLTLFRCTQGYSGKVSFTGFQLNSEAIVLAPPPAKRRIEVIGDSISAGVGVEAAHEKEPYSPKTDNAYWTYGAITARAFEAEYLCYALGGKRLTGEKSIPELYGRIFPMDPSSPEWNFELWKPQVLLINLGTNDFSKGPPEENSWVEAYHTFLDRIRRNYTDTTIYIALGPMLSDSWPKEGHHLTLARQHLQRVVRERNSKGDTQVYFLEFATEDQSMGVGAGGHPNLKRHQVMAQQWIESIQAHLKWTPETRAP